MNSIRAVSNKSTILRSVDKLLGVTKPPAIEYIYVEPAITFSLTDTKHSSGNPYGHACIRYTLPTAQGYDEKMMNIVGKKGNTREDKQMVHFMKPEDYFFGDPAEFTTEVGNEQGGVYNRHMIGFRIEEWPEELLYDMHKYYQNLSERDIAKEANFSLVLAPLTGYNYWSKFVWPFTRLAERGNCSYWTSKGLQEAQVIKYTMFPKNIGAKMYWKALRKYPDNFNIVSYRSPLSTVGEDGQKIKPSMAGWLKPFWWLEAMLFEKMDDMANVVVTIDKQADGETIAVPKLQEWKSRPFWKHK